jgi:hypothetical protein
MDNENQKQNQIENDPAANQPGQVIVPAAASQPASAVPPSAQQISALPVSQPQAAQPVAMSEPAQVFAGGDAAPDRARKRRWPFVLGTAVVLALLLGGGAYGFYATQHKNTVASKTTAGKSATTAKAASTTAKDTAAPVATTESCRSDSCFAPAFQSCTPATYTTNVSGFGGAKYVIIGKQKATGCTMQFEYTSNPNPDWVNKTLTCNFDNTKSLQDSVTQTFDDLLNKQNTYFCTGPLVAVLQNQ